MLHATISISTKTQPCNWHNPTPAKNRVPLMSTTGSQNTSNILYIRACVANINAFNSSLRSCTTGSQLPSAPFLFTSAAVAKARISFQWMCDKAIRSHSTPCEAACTRRSSNLAADADSSLSSYDVQLPRNTLNRIPMMLHATISISTLHHLRRFPFVRTVRPDNCWTS